MKKTIFFLFIIFLFSCGASKQLVTPADNMVFEPLSLFLIDTFKVDVKNFDKIQFFSGPDTIILSKKYNIAQSTVGSKGELVLTGGEPIQAIIILPNTPGILIKDGVLVDSKGKVQSLDITFSNQNKSLTYQVGSDEHGMFIAQNLPNMTKGGGSQLFVRFRYSEHPNVIKVEPGRRVGQQPENVNRDFLERIQKKKN